VARPNLREAAERIGEEHPELGAVAANDVRQAATALDVLDVARLRGHRGDPAALAELRAATARVEALLQRLNTLRPPAERPN
jgi:hypothetical protein